MDPEGMYAFQLLNAPLGREHALERETQWCLGTPGRGWRRQKWHLSLGGPELLGPRQKETGWEKAFWTEGAVWETVWVDPAWQES